MRRVFILNGHQPYAFAPGRLDATLAERPQSYLAAWGYELQVTRVAEGYDVDEEIAKHRWADSIVAA